MANEKVSQMTVLTAAEIAADDIFLVGDITARESKQITADQLLLFIESSGSFDAVNAGNADSASYILGSNVDGTVDSASYAASVTSASHALRADLAATASYFSSSVGAVFTTASFLQYTAPYSNGTASYALNAGTSLTATTAANLSYTGGPNGTASFAMSASNAYSASHARSASWAGSSSFSVTSSFTTTSSFTNHSVTSDSASYASSVDSPVKAWAMVTWSFAQLYNQDPQLYYGYNIDDIKYSSTWNSSNYTYLNFSVTFSSALPSTNYTLIGQAFSAYLDPEPADVIFHPVYSHRTTTTCLVSLCINTNVTSVANWIAGNSGSFPSTDQAYMTFQVLGT